LSHTKVIVISAVSGGGKTTIVKELVNQLPSSKALYFDEYDFDEYPKDYYEWTVSGSDYNLWNISPIVKDVNKIISENAVNYLLIDYPFAYQNNQMSPFIDIAIFIDTPLDIAMARRIMRDFSDKSMEDLKDELSGYVLKGRISYLAMLDRIKPDSDIVIDGKLSVDKIVNKILNEIVWLYIIIRFFINSAHISNYTYQ